MTHLWRRQVPRRYQTTLQYYSKNKSSKKITTNEDNAIEDINGIADNIQEQIREEDFTYADQNDIFWSEDNKPKVIYDGNHNMYEDQSIDSLYPESYALANAYNEYHFIKQKMLDELTASSNKLIKTAKQAGKELGEEGSGTPLYRDMAKKLKVCIQKLQDPECPAAETRLALKEFEKAAKQYAKERKSVFGKRGDGKTRYDVSTAYSGGRIQEMILTFDKNLRDVVNAGEKTRSNFDMDSLTDKTLAFGCGRALNIDKEIKIPRQKKSVLEKSYKAAEAMSKAQAVVKQTVFDMKNSDPATLVVLKGYYDEAMKSSATLDEVKNIGKAIKNKEYENEATKLKNNRVFKEIVKDYPKNYYKVWNNVCKNGAELKYGSNEYLEVTKTMFTKLDSEGNNLNNHALLDYVIPEGVPDKNTSKEEHDLAYKRLAQVVTSQILAKNDDFARGVVADALKNKTVPGEIVTMIRSEVEAKLKKSGVLDGKDFNVDKVGRELENGSIMKRTVVDMNRAKPQKQKEPVQEVKKTQKQIAPKAK